MPPALARRPIADTITSFLVEAFSLLNAGRQDSMAGPQPFSFQSLLEVCAYYGYVSISDRAFLIKGLQALDQFYLKKQRAKLEAQRKADEAARKSRR